MEESENSAGQEVFALKGKEAEEPPGLTLVSGHHDIFLLQRFPRQFWLDGGAVPEPVTWASAD